MLRILTVHRLFYGQPAVQNAHAEEKGTYIETGFRILTITYCLFAIVSRLPSAVSVRRGSQVRHQAGRSQEAPVVTEGFPYAMHNQRNLSQGTGPPSPGATGKERRPHFVPEKRHTVPVARTHDMEVTRTYRKSHPNGVLHGLILIFVICPRTGSHESITSCQGHEPKGPDQTVRQHYTAYSNRSCGQRTVSDVHRRAP